MENWYQSAPEAHKKKQRQKARELRTSQWWKLKLAEGLCHYCGQNFAPDELTMDHKVPVARGGCSNKGNVVTSCKPCNTAKKHLTPAEQILSQMTSIEHE